MHRGPFVVFRRFRVSRFRFRCSDGQRVDGVLDPIAHAGACRGCHHRGNHCAASRTPGGHTEGVRSVHDRIRASSWAPSGFAMPSHAQEEALMPRRRPPRRDGLLDHVADSFLSRDLARALSKIPSHQLEFVQYLLSDELYPASPAGAGYVCRVLSLVRERTDDRDRLLEYHGERSTQERHCRGCTSPLAGGGGPGRPRVYCSNRCRQLTYRNRKRIRQDQQQAAQLILECIRGLSPERLEYARRMVTKSPPPPPCRPM